MTDEFTTRLRLQLREAALREEQRGGFARAVSVPRRIAAPLTLGPLVAAAAGALVVVVGVWVLSVQSETATPPAAPRVVANVAIAGGLSGSARTGFGSVWLSDSNQGQILRVDPRTRRVTARIPVGGEASIDVGAGSVWAAGNGISSGPLLRIDPRTGKVVKRIPMRTPSGVPFQGGFVLTAPSRVWVLGNGAIAIDPVTNRVVGEIRLGGAYQIIDAHVKDGELWLTRADRSITRFDAVTGRRLGRTSWPARGFLFPYADKLVSVGPNAVSLVDPATGRALWTSRIGTKLDQATLAGGRLFVEGANGASPRDEMWALDPRTGRIAGTLTVPEFSVVGMTPVGRDVWMITAGGRAVIVSS
jgi:hypothetical protein